MDDRNLFVIRLHSSLVSSAKDVVEKIIEFSVKGEKADRIKSAGSFFVKKEGRRPPASVPLLTTNQERGVTREETNTWTT